MARYTGPVCRLCRRERTKLYLKGERCFTMKCPVAENSDRQMRAFPPGMHGRDRQRQGSEYLTQLREKQKARRIYGLLGKAVPQPLRRGQSPSRHDRYESAAVPGAAPRQHRLPRRLGRVARPGPPVRASRPRDRRRQARQHPVVPRSSRRSHRPQERHARELQREAQP